MHTVQVENAVSFAADPYHKSLSTPAQLIIK